jgi:AcrR family transcriptional regulator
VPQPPQSARGERTRDALRRAAQVRFLAQGVEATSAEQIAADVGVSLRTFYRHFASKHELLFGDYDASLQWFRSALESRPLGESITEAVLAAIYSFPFDQASMYEVAELRDRTLDREQVEKHINHVQSEFAVEVERHLLRQGTPGDNDAKFLSSVVAQCVAAATFAAVDNWMRGDHSDLEELARLTELALGLVEQGLVPFAGGRASRKSVKFDETGGA